jgi:hypothetical protein
MQYPGTRGLSRVFAKSGETPPRERFLESRYELGAWVSMNRVHIALRPLGDQDLAATVRSIKGRSAHAANRLLHRLAILGKR